MSTCAPYITHDELASCCDAVDTESAGDDPTDTLFAREVATSMLFYATGQQFPGVCDVYLRPCFECAPCGDGRPWTPYLVDGRYLNVKCNKQSCACTETAEIDLDGYPVQSVEAVYVNGDSISFNVYGKTTVTVPSLPNFPWCQDWSKSAFPDPEDPGADLDGTWGIHFKSGIEPPAILKQAAKDLACHFQNLCLDDCNTCAAAIGYAANDGNLDLSFANNLPMVFVGIPSADFAIKALNPYSLGRAQARLWTPEARKDRRENLAIVNGGGNGGDGGGGSTPSLTWNTGSWNDGQWS